MKKAAIYQSMVQNGRMNQLASKQIAAKLAGCEGKMVRVTIEEVKRTRSLNQNAFYWGVVVPMVRGLFHEHGNDATEDAVHVYLKEHVGGMVENIVDPDGEVHRIVSTSTDLTTAAWEDYMTKIRAWAATFDMIIPLPNEGKY